jgi:Ribbon-helix-helix protein, copG family
VTSGTVVPTSVRLPRPVHEALNALALRRRVPRSDLIRAAVVEFVEMQTVPVHIADDWTPSEPPVGTGWPCGSSRSTLAGMTRGPAGWRRANWPSRLADWRRERSYYSGGRPGGDRPILTYDHPR